VKKKRTLSGRENDYLMRSVERGAFVRLRARAPGCFARYIQKSGYFTFYKRI